MKVKVKVTNVSIGAETNSKRGEESKGLQWGWLHIITHVDTYIYMGKLGLNCDITCLSVLSYCLYHTKSNTNSSFRSFSVIWLPYQKNKITYHTM